MQNLRCGMVCACVSRIVMLPYTNMKSDSMKSEVRHTVSQSGFSFFCSLPTSPNSSNTPILMPFPPLSLHHASSQNFLEKAPTSTGPTVLGTRGLSSAPHINSDGPGHWLVRAENTGTLPMRILLPATSTVGGWKARARPRAQRCAQPTSACRRTPLL